MVSPSNSVSLIERSTQAVYRFAGGEAQPSASRPTQLYQLRRCWRQAANKPALPRLQLTDISPGDAGGWSP